MEELNPYSAPASSDSEGLFGVAYRASFRRIAAAWLCFCLITLIATIVIALVVGAVLVGGLVAIGADRDTAMAIKPIYTGICSNLVPIPVSLLVYWWTVNRIVLKRITLREPSAT